MWKNGQAHYQARSDMDTLYKLKKLNSSTIFPGHGAHFDNPASVQAKLDEYIDHRIQRETQIIEVLRQSKQPLAATEIVKSIYVDLPAKVLPMAAFSVLAHIGKLLKEDRVIEYPEESGDTRKSAWALK